MDSNKDIKMLIDELFHNLLSITLLVKVSFYPTMHMSFNFHLHYSPKYHIERHYKFRSLLYPYCS